jgi:hypothetical protein
LREELKQSSPDSELGWSDKIEAVQRHVLFVLLGPSRNVSITKGGSQIKFSESSSIFILKFISTNTTNKEKQQGSPLK